MLKASLQVGRGPMLEAIAEFCEIAYDHPTVISGRLPSGGRQALPSLDNPGLSTFQISANVDLMGLHGNLNAKENLVDMTEQSKLSECQVRECLKNLGVSLLVDWEVLVFLQRHQLSLTNADQMARLLGYRSKAMGDALGRLESNKLVRRSRPSQGVRFYQFVFPGVQDAPLSCLRRLLSLAETRDGRLLVIAHLDRIGSPYIAAKGRLK